MLTGEQGWGRDDQLFGHGVNGDYMVSSDEPSERPSSKWPSRMGNGLLYPDDSMVEVDMPDSEVDLVNEISELQTLMIELEADPENYALASLIEQKEWYINSVEVAMLKRNLAENRIMMDRLAEGRFSRREDIDAYTLLQYDREVTTYVLTERSQGRFLTSSLDVNVPVKLLDEAIKQVGNTDAENTEVATRLYVHAAGLNVLRRVVQEYPDSLRVIIPEPDVAKRASFASDPVTFLMNLRPDEAHPAELSRTIRLAVGILTDKALADKT